MSLTRFVLFVDCMSDIVSLSASEGNVFSFKVTEGGGGEHLLSPIFGLMSGKRARVEKSGSERSRSSWKNSLGTIKEEETHAVL